MAHIHELIDFVTSIVIVHEDRVLLVHHRKLDKWLPVGGHVELNEDTDQALFREISEECGLEVEVLGEKANFNSSHTKALYVPTFMDIHNLDDTHKHIGLIYIGKSKTDRIVHNTEEHYDIRWFTKEELNTLGKLPSQIKYYAISALERVKNS